MKTRYGALVLSLILGGCATSSVLVGTQRPEIPVESVRVYLQPPAQYEQVALLESSSEGAMFALSAQQKTNKVIERLKEEAAALGANGILIQGIGSGTRGAVLNSYGSANAGNYVGTGIAIPIMVKEGTAIAIYVAEPVASGSQTGQPPQPPQPVPAKQAPAQIPADGCVSCQQIGKDF